MNRIDFTKPGGFPFTQDALAFMQSDYVRSLNGLASAWTSAQGAQYVILSGCVDTGGVISSGICSVNGELVYCAGGSGANVRMVETTQNATFENGQVHPVYVTRMLVFGDGEGQIPWTSFVRIPKVATSTQGSKADSAIQAAMLGDADVIKSGTLLQFPAYPTSLPANGGNADTVGNHTPDDFILDEETEWVDLSANPNITIVRPIQLRKGRDGYADIRGVFTKNTTSTTQVIISRDAQLSNLIPSGKKCTGFTTGFGSYEFDVFACYLEYSGLVWQLVTSPNLKDGVSYMMSLTTRIYN